MEEVGLKKVCCLDVLVFILEIVEVLNFECVFRILLGFLYCFLLVIRREFSFEIKGFFLGVRK